MRNLRHIFFYSMIVLFITGCDEIEGDAAHIQLGTANDVSSIQGLQYQKSFVAQVTDVNGNPVSDASVKIKVIPVYYVKGSYVWLDDNLILTTSLTDAVRWGLYLDLDGVLPDNTSYTVCSAEDSNNNAVLDTGEDTNGNGVLDPSNPATLTAHATALPTLDPINNRISTDDSGFGYFSITFPESVASWTTVRVIASTNVSGTESTQTLDVTLAPPITDLTSVDTAPPGGSQYSPYGTASVCTNPN